MTSNNETKKGIVFAILAYCMWGFAPLYFKQLNNVPAYEILAHRALWSFIFIAILLTTFKLWGNVKRVLSKPKNVLLLCSTAVLISFNWLTYIWAVNNDHLLDASLGYFISPIFNVLLGMMFLAEKLRKLQWVAIILAAVGVLVQLVTLGYLPWVALVLSCTFGVYGLLRKKLHVNALVGLFIETLLMLPIALSYLLLFANSATADFSNNSSFLIIMLVCAGIVTTLPLLCFNNAAIRLPLSTLGFFQYIGPTIMFVLGAVLYNEEINPATLTTFMFIWVALIIFSFDGFRTSRKSKLKIKPQDI